MTLGTSLKLTTPLLTHAWNGILFYHVKVFGIIESFIHLLTRLMFLTYIHYILNNGAVYPRQTLWRKETVNYIRGRNTRRPEVTLQEHFTQSRAQGRPSGGCEVEIET